MESFPTLLTLNETDIYEQKHEMTESTELGQTNSLPETSYHLLVK